MPLDPNLDPDRRPVAQVHYDVPAEEQHRRVEEGTGFFAPEPPDADAVRSYMSLYVAERAEWGEPPELGVLRTPYADSVTGYALPISEGTWAAIEDPGKVLNTLVRVLWTEARTDHALLRNVDRTMLADMVGVYFRTEGWAPPKGQELTALRLSRTGLNYRFENAEDRRECRVITAVMIDGSVVRATEFRDEPGELRSGVHHLLREEHMNPALGSPSNWIGGQHLTAMLKISYGLVAYMRPPHANTAPPEGGRTV